MLAQIFDVMSLDEDMLFGFTVLLMDHSGGVTAATKEKTLQQLKACRGLGVVVNFLFSDDSVHLKLPVSDSDSQDNAPGCSWKDRYLS